MTRSTNGGPLTIHASHDLIARLRRTAKTTDRPLSAVCRILIAHGLADKHALAAIGMPVDDESKD